MFVVKLWTPRQRRWTWRENIRDDIWRCTRGEHAGGDDAGGDDFSSQFLNDFGEGVEVEQSRDNEGALTNSSEVY